jgi:hypothetical protein
VSFGAVTKKDYQSLIGESFKTKMDRAVNLLKRFDGLFTWIKQPRQLFALSYYLKPRNYARGATIYK